MLTKNGAWRDVVVVREEASSSDAPLEISRLPRTRRLPDARGARTPENARSKRRWRRRVDSNWTGVCSSSSAVWVAGLLVVVFGISANRAEQSGNKLIDFRVPRFLFKRINPYMFAAFGIAFAIGFSVLGAAWCVPRRLERAARSHLPPYPANQP